MQKILIGIFTILGLSSFCLNLYHVNHTGQEFYDAELYTLPIFYQSFNQEHYKGLIEKIDSNLSVSPDDFQLSDKAVVLMKLGKVKKAQNLLLQLYKKNPLEYNFVINLGTSYELTNNVDSALLLIRKSLEINQTSHRGSEWFHLKVLEAKQKMDNNPNWLKENKVLNIELAELNQDSIILTDTLTKILVDISYQLVERIPFSKSNDLLLANIFNEYGSLLSKYSAQMAYIIYSIGNKYDEESIFKMDEKSKKLKLLIQSNDHNIKVPDINSFYPSKDKFAKNPEKIELGPRIHRDLLNDGIGESIYKAVIILGIVLFSIISLIIYLIIKRIKRKK